MEEQLKQAKLQRLESLRNAFNTIRVFATPSCDPEQFENFEKLETYLKKIYEK